MLAVNRFIVAEDAVGAFVERAQAALAVLATQPGYRWGHVTRSLDEPQHWCLVTEWESVGTYRRALNAFDVKVHATPLLAEALDEPSAYEVLASAEPGGPVTTSTSDRASDPQRR